MAARPVEYALLLVLATLWSGSFTFIALAIHDVPPVTLICARSLIACLVLTGVLYARGLALPKAAAMWRRCLAQATLSSVMPFLLIAYGQQSVPSGLAVVLSSTSPIFAFLLGLLLVPGQRPRWLQLAGAVLGLGGVVLILGKETLAEGAAGLWPAMALLGSGVCFGAGAHVAKSLQTVDPMIPAAASLLAGSCLLLPLSLATEHPWTLAPGLQAVLAVLGLAVFSTAVAVLIYYRLLRTLGVVGTTAQAYLRVPIGAALGVLLLDERFPPHAWAGLVLVVLGVAAMTWPAPSGTQRSVGEILNSLKMSYRRLFLWIRR